MEAEFRRLNQIKQFISTTEPALDVIAYELLRRIKNRRNPLPNMSRSATWLKKYAELDIKRLLLILDPELIPLLVSKSHKQLMKLDTPFPNPQEPYAGVYMGGLLVKSDRAFKQGEIVRIANILRQPLKVQAILKEYNRFANKNTIASAEALGRSWKSMLDEEDLWVALDELDGGDFTEDSEGDNEGEASNESDVSHESDEGDEGDEGDESGRDEDDKDDEYQDEYEDDEEYQDEYQESSDEDDVEIVKKDSTGLPIPPQLFSDKYLEEPRISFLYTGYSVNPNKRCGQHQKRIPPLNWLIVVQNAPKKGLSSVVQVVGYISLHLFGKDFAKWHGRTIYQSWFQDFKEGRVV